MEVFLLIYTKIYMQVIIDNNIYNDNANKQTKTFLKMKGGWRSGVGGGVVGGGH